MFTLLRKLQFFKKSKVFNPIWASKFSEIKNRLKTGDVILVDGDYKGAKFLDWLQGNRWGHSAMVIEKKHLNTVIDTTDWPDLLIWESNQLIECSTPNLWDTNFQEIKEGPMLVSLEERLRHSQRTFNNVAISYRELLLDKEEYNNLNFEKLPKLFDKIIDRKFPSKSEIIFDIYVGRKYNKSINYESGYLRKLIFCGNIIEIGNWSKKIENHKEIKEKDRVYCTEAMAIAYKELGLLTTNHVSNAYAPKDFSQDGDLRLLKGAEFGSEINFNIFE